ncbi:hypothetical protein R3P38DRAFT_2810467 [Favolaschia claudopus]|uniref:Bacteriophage T5 Orf172 DNA-binding domain-containing protein n=1 Tax=Favolaschia claudopus TaxID=2862362 RepID=A0AAV9ZAT8_9AGAR
MSQASHREIREIWKEPFDLRVAYLRPCLMSILPSLSVLLTYSTIPTTLRYQHVQAIDKRREVAEARTSVIDVLHSARNKPPHAELYCLTLSGHPAVRGFEFAVAPVLFDISIFQVQLSDPKTVKRTPSQERAFRKIRQLPPLEQKAALIEHADDLPYLRECDGYIYLTAQLPEDVVRGQQPKEIEAELMVKWGETRRLTGRQEDYRRCEAGRTQMWIEAVHVERRSLIERLIHLELAARGYRRVIFVNPCGCGHRHREYVYMGGRSLADIESIMRGCLKEAGESNAQIISIAKLCAPADEGLRMLEDDVVVG